jgi:hypothetical protein
MNQDLMILKKELIEILANIPTTLGGGNHGHAGILMDPPLRSLIWRTRCMRLGFILCGSLVDISM